MCTSISYRKPRVELFAQFKSGTIGDRTFDEGDAG